MKKKVISMLLACCMVASLAACGDSGAGGSSSDNAQNSTSQGSEAQNESTSQESESNGGDAAGGELVDGKFAETRHITVEVYDRGNDGGSDPTNNMYTKYIQEGMLADHNVEVEFVAVPRWTEVEQINNLLAAGDAPDICVTYDYPTINTYANMGGVLDMSPLVDNYKDELTNLWDWLGETNIYWDKDPEKGTLWALEGKMGMSNGKATFVRQDWLDKLNMKAPTTIQEFEDMLIAFRDNAELLLGSDANKMIPYSVSYDVGWRAFTLIESFIDPDITDKEYYITGFDDRNLTRANTKEAIRLLNKWYNDNLLWKDFALYGSGDTTEDDMMKAGYVGAFTHSWDQPYRNGEDSINASLQRIVGEDAKFVAINCFENSKGDYAMYTVGSVDRKVFFPSTNDEPLASMLYLDWITDPEHIEYLQIGDENVTHRKLEDGAVEVIAATGDAIQNSGFNIDYTLTCNGMKLVDEEQTLKSVAYSYAGVDPEVVEAANKATNEDGGEMTVIRMNRPNLGEITAEEGMGPALSEKRDILYDTALSASVEEFDAVWDAGMEDYLNAGGQAIMDEREAKWNAAYGDAEMVP